MRLFGNMEVINNELYIAGISVMKLSEKYGTPLYVMDENLIRENCRKYLNNFRGRDENNIVAYAGKAFLPMAMCNILDEEGLYLDVVSAGELYTAYKSKFPMEKVLFHGNNKTWDEINMGIELGVGRFVVDNIYEVERINSIAFNNNVKQNILMRITPGIEAHTHDYIKTGQIDSKFGFAIEKQDILKTINYINKLENVNLIGLHCHIGSQIFDMQPYKDCVKIMMNIIKEIKEKLSFDIQELDLGGGFGIYYTHGDNPLDTKICCETILESVQTQAELLKIKAPRLIIEPGRSIVGNAGVTLYKIGGMKNIPGVRKYAAVDGGMSDNIRPSLYNANYECCIGNKYYCNDMETVTICGKCCESGDILIKDTYIPKINTGDLLVVASTGAYCYSMSNNYNKIPKASVVMVKEGRSKLICRRETFEDMIKNEMAL